jgi:drug/metabolite transporter (DMT)-like permease
MSILSPLTAVVSAIVPLTVGLIDGERLQPIGYVALGIALVAVVLVGFVPTGADERPAAAGERAHAARLHAVRPSLKGVAMAIGSGIAIGAFLIVIDATPDDSGLVPLVVNRAANASLMFAAVGIVAFVSWRRSRATGIPAESRGWRAGVALTIACGLIDATANAGLLVGIRLGELSVMAVLTALYPAGTIILAAIVLKERIAWLQYVGLALALIAGAMLALA